MAKTDSDTLAKVAGSIAAGLIARDRPYTTIEGTVVRESVRIARLILEEVETSNALLKRQKLC